MECWTSKNSVKLKQYYYFHAEFLEEVRYKLLYRQKYWRELNLVVGPKIAIAKVLADLNLAAQ